MILDGHRCVITCVRGELHVFVLESRFCVHGQQIDEADPNEKLATLAEHIGNSQSAVCGDRHVVHMDKFAHPGGIEAGDSLQIQQESPLATTEERVDFKSKSRVDRRTKGPKYAKNGGLSE